MSTTIPAQTADVTVSHTGGTIEQANLIVQMQIASAQSGADRGMAILWNSDSPLSLEELRAAHDKSSQGYRDVMSALSNGEIMSTFVRQGILDEAFVNDLWWVAGVWKRCEKIAMGLREEAGEPRLYENFEWLAKRPG